MPSDAISALSALAPLIEKLGVIGLLLIGIGWLAFERVRLMRDLTKAYRQRDRWRIAYTKCKGALDANKITIDLSDLSDMLGPEEAT